MLWPVGKIVVDKKLTSIGIHIIVVKNKLAKLEV